MGTRGPIPKDHRSRPRDEITPTVLASVKPPKPPALPKGYSAETQSWWATWARSPQSVEFAETDWMRLLMLAPLVEAYFAKPDRFLMGEIRASESKLGCMVEDRKRLRLKIASTPPRPSAKGIFDHLREKDDPS